MADRPYKIKGVDNNDELLYIGSLFRHAYSTDWHLQVRFKKSEKKSVLASLLPDLVVGRTYNSTSEISTTSNTEDFTWNKIVGNKSGSELKIKNIGDAKRNERYFLLKNEDEYLAFPQLELARALFIENSKMFHYALEPISLGIDFKYYKPTQDNLIIEVCDSAQLTKNQFERVFNPNKLAFTLTDAKAHVAFLSINNNFLNYRFDKKEKGDRLSTWWRFGFDAPALNGSRLKVFTNELTGTFNHRRVRVINEILSITNIPHDLPQNIVFTSKKWLRTALTKVTDSDNDLAIVAPTHYEIDDQQSASSFLPEKIIRAQGNHEFSLDPIRQAKTLTAKGKIRLIFNDANDREVEISDVQLASTELPSILGDATPVVTSTNTSDEASSSAFIAFKSMIDLIQQHKHLELTEYAVRKLHKVGRSRLHKMKVGNSPRSVAIAHFSHSITLTSYSLVEIDVSDTDKKLSTLIFKYNCLDQARMRLDPILSAFVAKSLSWPRKYLQENNIFADFITHPTGLNITAIDDQGDLIMIWANNTLKKMRAL